MAKFGSFMLAVACALSAQTAVAASRYLDDMVISEMTDADIDILYSSVRATLDDNADGAAAEWSNPETGAHGVITPLKTYNAYETTCRLTRFESTAGGNSTRNNFSLCRMEDGSWKVAATDSASLKQGGTAGQSDRCKQLSQEIEALKGKPLQRSAAMDRYDAECKQALPDKNPGSLQ